MQCWASTCVTCALGISLLHRRERVVIDCYLRRCSISFKHCFVECALGIVAYSLSLSFSGRVILCFVSVHLLLAERWISAISSNGKEIYLVWIDLAYLIYSLFRRLPIVYLTLQYGGKWAHVSFHRCYTLFLFNVLSLHGIVSSVWALYWYLVDLDLRPDRIYSMCLRFVQSWRIGSLSWRYQSQFSMIVENSVTKLDAKAAGIQLNTL